MNRFINEQIRYVSDYELHQTPDLWAAPVATLQTGGDCEDFALLKAASLAFLGWDADSVTLLVGWITEDGRKRNHAVLLAVTPAGEQLILDSADDAIARADESRFHANFGATEDELFLVNYRSG